MRGSRRRATPGSYPAVAAVAVVALAAGAAGAGADPGPTTVVGAGASTQRDRVTLLGGSRDLLVYALQPVLASDVGQASVPLSLDDALVARAADGTQTVLARTSELAALHDLTVAGSAVAAVERDDASLVHWWDVAADTRGVLTLPAGQRYLTVLPDGLLVIGADGLVSHMNFSGTMTGWTQPFGGQPPRDVFPAVGPDGVVFGDGTGQARYIRFADPATAAPLKAGSSRQVVCWAASRRYAACTTRGWPAGRPQRPALLSLRGGKPVVPRNSHDRFGPVALDGSDHLVWERFTAHGADGVLASITPTRTSPRTGHRHVAFGQLRTAYGRLVTLPPAQHTTLVASRDLALKTLHEAPRSPATAAGFALSTSRIVDADDARSPSQSAPVVVRERDVSSTASGVALGSAHLVAAPGRKHPVIDHLAISGNRVAYVRSADGVFGRLHVVTPHRTVVIRRLIFGSDIALSGHWVAYDASRPGHFDRKLHVRNLDTGKDIVVAKHGDQLYDAAAISRATLYYGTPSGRILARDLRTGKQVELSAPIPAREFTAIRVYAAAGRVGWEVWRGGDSDAVYTDVVRDRDGAQTALSSRLVGLSAAGALLSTEPLQAFGFGPRATATTISLRRWDGTTSHLIAGQPLAAEPQLAGDVVGWLTSDGVLKVGGVGA